MINITNKAKKHFLNKKPDYHYVLIYLKKTGCSGYSYQVDWIKKDSFNSENQELQIIETEKNENNFGIVYNKKDKERLGSITIDYERQGLNQTLTFQNPNVTGMCGCGMSVSFVKGEENEL